MRLLVVNYDYPRPGDPGANRWAAMSKYLRRLGHEVTVVTPVAPGMAPGEADGVVRTRDLNSSALLRSVLRRAPVGAASEAPVTSSPVASALLMRVIVPDAYLVGWSPWANSAVKRLLDDREIECLITSGPPQSTHLLGLRSRQRATWIADFRDGWLFEPLEEPFPTAPQRALARRLERLVATRADAVVGVTRPIVDDFRVRLGVPAELITNGWDPEMRSAHATSSLLDVRKFTFVHTGIVSGAWGRDPRPVFDAVRLLLDRDPALAERVEFAFAGTATSGDLELLRDPILRGCVRHIPPIGRDEALALQRGADALLLLTSGRVSEATGKLFEYLGAGRPIIALAEGNEAARIIAETGTGVSVPLRDVEAIAAQLRRAIDGELQRSYAPRGLEAYTYPCPAQRMAELAARVAGQRTSA